MKRRPLKAYVLAAILTSSLLSHLGLAQSGQVTDSNTAMKNIRKHLFSSSERTYNEPLLFVGVINCFGPIYMGACKEAVGESVDFKIESVVWGTPPDSQLRASYINCSHNPLPAPPYTLHGRVIVYCEQVPSLKCLAPVEYSEQRLEMVKSWSAHP